VLFRNNFALSRDITGLFQSFQLSSTVLDPAANPDLFRSMLVIIIKAGSLYTRKWLGTYELSPRMSSTPINRKLPRSMPHSPPDLLSFAEHGNRFSLKLKQIVQQEQEANFISRLHGGRVSIIPWPHIESERFYDLFPRLKKCLDREPATYACAGVFLQTFKTLMAKVKVHDCLHGDTGRRLMSSQANDWGAMSRTRAFSFKREWTVTNL
jgi:hypothetical protein